MSECEYNTLTEALNHVRMDCECDEPPKGGVYVAEVYRYQPSGHPVKVIAGGKLPEHPWRKHPESPRPDADLPTIEDVAGMWADPN